MKSVLVVGAGRGQIPMMNLCHDYGCYVHAVSPKGNYPGIKVADEVLYADVRNHDELLKYASTHQIEAVITDQLDVGVYTAAYIAEKLKIPGITTAVAEKFTNKFCMREAAQAAGINVPKHIILNNLEHLEEKLSELTFPLMMKPVDSDASRGVYKVYSAEEIRDHYESSTSYSKSGNIILEEFIEGKEYVVEAFTRDYQVHNLVVGHRDYFQIPNTFIPNATVFCDANSASSPIEMRLKETNAALISAFGLHFGITHAEYLYHEKTDQIYLVEIAARGGGVFISSDLIPLACGVNANDLLVQEALGFHNNAEITLRKGAAAYFCYLTPEGTVCKLEHTGEIEKMDGVHKAFFDNIELGMKTGSIRDKSSRKGPILVKGNTKDECYNIIEKVQQRLKIKVKTNTGIEEVLWK